MDLHDYADLANKYSSVVASRIRPLSIRHTYRQKMEYLLELCGFEILDVYNNYRYDAAKDMSVWVVKSNESN